MTTDAKIGLLLALIFIVAITFVINGLPDFLSKNKQIVADTTGYVNHYKEQQPALVGPSRNIAPALSHKPVITVITETPQIEQSNPSQERLETLMPAAQEAVKTMDTAEVNTLQQKELVEIKTAQKATTQPQSGITYVVCSGDSVAEIAKKMYGPDNGKKAIAIEKIFNANRDKLASIDKISVGQELIIPPFDDKENTLLKTGLFEKVSKISSSQTPAAPVKATQPSKKPARLYIVKDSDSLWQIAQDQLGNGNRYHEIIELNKSVLKNADNLIVGMKLSLPAK